MVIRFFFHRLKFTFLQKLKEELGDNFHFIKVDLCSEENILEAFSWVKSNLKSVDVLINNAGVLKQSDLLGKLKIVFIIYTIPNTDEPDDLSILQGVFILFKYFNLE